ncbi:MAG TPA: Tim44-like domain-containing protein [Myxococcales bacterium]|nr:Tim44-like domain-containing protein [Myxococcales bacterium]
MVLPGRSLGKALLRWTPSLIVLAAALQALARVGGGQSFSGGGHGGSSGGGGNGIDGELIWILVQVLFRYPVVGIPVAGLVVYVLLRQSRAPRPGDAPPLETDDFGEAPPMGSARRQLLELMRPDTGFSLVLFEDFLYALYAAAQEARAGGRLETLSAFLSEAARRAIDVSRPARVEAVIVGGLYPIDAVQTPGSPFIQVRVRFESNYSEVPAQGPEQTFYAVEIWTLRRAATARSRPPDQTRVFKCPSCGGPLEGVIAGKCSYCGKDVATGEFDWLVESVEILEREARQPVLFSDEDPPEISPVTKATAGVDQRLGALEARDPTFSFDAFRQRAEMIFLELQAAWSTRNWKRARPFTSDRLFHEWSHWMELYQRAHARNVVDRPRLDRLEVCDVESDRYYDAITCRLQATCVDYTLSDDGKLLGGQRDRERPFSEYWTLIRGAGAKGPASAQKKCPSCGADLEINMAGRCEYCKAEVSSGAFDWVLSRIEQDAAYEG